MSANVVPIADGIEAQDTRTGPEEGGAVIPRQRCTFPGCGRRLEFAPVEGVASSVGLRSGMRRKVCQDHPPVGACSRCGILAGPQYMVKGTCTRALPGLCGEACTGSSGHRLSRSGPEVDNTQNSPAGVTPRLTKRSKGAHAEVVS